MADPANSAQAIIEAMRELAISEVIDRVFDPNMLHGLVIPEGKHFVDLTPALERLRDAPRHLVAQAEAGSVASLIDYVKRFRHPDSAIFADFMPGNSYELVAVIDYHGQGASAEPRFGHHCISYRFPLSAAVDTDDPDRMGPGDRQGARTRDEPDDRYIPRSAVYKLRAINWGSPQRIVQLARTVEISVNAKSVESYDPKSGSR